ncbi:hypothetical protein GALMADRAFT_1208909 [Galerina marginata CBS 339.88]|uniref:Uncharacterized protein n=1 Tax=Galerina marginata (strain CBS 339.88) TaxID=685588 RepID=A0A067SH74_GALM3|nr:hypothetical protein GALMADRAFT_1208909 [Galerina marginata CBS 339.88]
MPASKLGSKIPMNELKNIRAKTISISIRRLRLIQDPGHVNVNPASWPRCRRRQAASIIELIDLVTREIRGKCVPESDTPTGELVEDGMEHAVLDLDLLCAYLEMRCTTSPRGLLDSEEGRGEHARSPLDLEVGSQAICALARTLPQVHLRLEEFA